MENKRLSDREFLKNYPDNEFLWSILFMIIYFLFTATFSFLLPLFLVRIGIMISKILFFDIEPYAPLLFILVSIFFFCRLFYMFYKLGNPTQERKNFAKKLGMSENDCINYYKELKKVLPHITYFSIVQQVCKLNTSARCGQETLLKGLFGLDESTIKKFVFEKEYDSDDLAFFAKDTKKLSLSERKKFADLLFKLTFVQDGIHNDEWNLLMDLLVQLDFNDNYINYYFKKRYGPLRTEFELNHNNGRKNDHKEDRKEDSSTKVHSVHALNPYYAILGLDSNASDEDIKRAYHNLALQYHPDLAKNAGRIQECEEMMAKINEAYEKVRG